MKRIAMLALIILVFICLTACLDTSANEESSVQVETEDAINEQTIVNLVTDFGSRLQMVSLLVPQDVIVASMEKYYGNLVTPGLLKKWQEAPMEAPGRMVSSPWPDRIEIITMDKRADDLYEVNGEIIEITSVEKENGGFAAKRPVTIMVEKTGDDWLIESLILGAYENNSIIYKNDTFGFSITLPQDWQGYKIVEDEWYGYTIGEEDAEKTGLIILIRHPRWSEQIPRQDIPIMIFTIEEWQSLENEEFHIGAAPISPSEIGRNNKYVFALPARYNYAFLPGYEEVEEILNVNPLQTEDIS